MSNSQLQSAENTLKEAYNNYIESLVAYLIEVKKPENKTSNGFKENNAEKYILDSHISVGLRNSLEIVRAANTEKLLSKKVV